MTTFTWTVRELERITADGRVINLAYRITADDGTNTVDFDGDINLDGEVTTPYEDLTEEMVVGWLFDYLGEEQKNNDEGLLQWRLDQLANPVKSKGLPWT